MSRTKNTLRNIKSGFINKVILLLCPFIIRTILIKKLGSEYLGLSSLFTSILQVLNLTELGFSSAVVFSMYKPIANNDKKTICALLSYYKRIYQIIGCIILLCGLLCLPFLPHLIKGSYPNDINIYLLYLIYLVNTAVSYFLFAYKTALITAHQREDILNNINTIVSILQYVLQLIILLVFKNYYAYIIVMVATTILNNMLVGYISKKKYPDYFCKGSISKEEKEEIKKKVKGLLIQRIAATTRNSLDSIFISTFLGLNAVAMYINYYYIMTSVSGIITIIITSMIASVGNSVVGETVEKNYKNMGKFNFIYMWISGWCTVCLFCLYQPFMELWVGSTYMFPLSIVLSFCVYFYILKMGDIISVYYQATGLWYEGRYRAIIESSLNIILNYVLGKAFGVMGIIMATEISILFVAFGYGSTIIFKHYFKGQNVFDYFKYHLFYLCITIFVAFITYQICLLFSFSTCLTLIVRGIICLIIPNIMYLLIYCKLPIFEESLHFIKNILQKKKNWCK